MQSTLNRPVIGLNLAKSVFQLHIVCIESGEIQRRQIKSAKLTEFFAKCSRSLVAMEACGSSHYWARTIRALVAAVGDFCTFKSARQFASWVGLVPRHASTGGKTQQLGISKRGDTYLRTLLVAGARAVIARSGKSDWIERLLQRRHYNVVVVALANKMARTVWAVLARGMAFDRTRWNPLETATA